MEFSIEDLRRVASALRSLWLEASESAEDMDLEARVRAEIERREADAAARC